MKTNILTLFLSCLLTICFGQSKRYVEGYVIYTNGDTIRGFIKDIGYEERSEIVLFKKTLRGEEVRYEGDDLKGYKIGEREIYESIPVNLRSDETYRRLFLRKLVEGFISLYRLDHVIYQDVSPGFQYVTTFYFYKNQGEKELQELREYEYKGTLENEFGTECSLGATKSFTYDDIGLADLISEYNKCKGAVFKVFVTALKKRNYTFGVSAGLCNSEINTKNSAYEEFDIDPGIGYSTNIYIDFRLVNQLFLQGGLSFAHKKTTGTNQHVVNEFYDNEGDVLELESGISLTQIIVPISLRYNLLEKKVTPYVSLGGYGGIALNNTSYLDKVDFVHINNEDIQFAERNEEVLAGLNSLELGWRLGVGVEYRISEKKSVCVEILYTNGKNNLPKTYDNSVSNRTYGFLVGFNF